MVSHLLQFYIYYYRWDYHENRCRSGVLHASSSYVSDTILRTISDQIAWAQGRIRWAQAERDLYERPLSFSPSVYAIAQEYALSSSAVPPGSSHVISARSTKESCLELLETVRSSSYIEVFPWLARVLSKYGQFRQNERYYSENYCCVEVKHLSGSANKLLTAIDIYMLATPKSSGFKAKPTDIAFFSREFLKLSRRQSQCR